MNGFVFPDDLREGDVILVADKFEVETVLRAFQEFGWKWNGGQDPLDQLNHLIDVLGISAHYNKILGWCDKSTSPYDFNRLYRRVFNASDIFPTLNADDIPDPDFRELDLSEFLSA